VFGRSYESRIASVMAARRRCRRRLTAVMLASALMLSVSAVVPPAGAQAGGEADPPVLVVALESSLSDVGTAASLVAAGKGDAVVFAVSVDSLGDASADLVRVQMPERIYIVGGTSAVGADVEHRLRSLAPGVSITRFAGSTRVETAALAADEALDGRSASKIIVANGWSLPDVGAAAAAVAAGAADAVLYAGRDVLGEPTRDALGAQRPATVLIAGGPAALSAGVEAAAATAAGGATTSRLAGATRLETAARVAQEALPDGATTVVVADGWSLADVGVAATLAASMPDSAVLYSADGDDLPAALDAALRSLAPDRIVLVDARSAASRGVLNGLARRGTSTRISSTVNATRAALGEDVGERVEVEEADPAAAIANAEAYMVELVNELRESVGVPPLHPNDLISNVARNWSTVMQERTTFEHNPNWRSEYPPGNVSGGENISRLTWPTIRYGNENNAYVPCPNCITLRTATQESFDSLKDSPGHYANMVHPNFGQIGVGIVAGPNSVWFTQNFACYATRPLQPDETCPSGPGPTSSATEIDVDDLSVVAGIEAPYSVSSIRDGEYVAMDYSVGVSGGLCAIRSDNSIMCWSGNPSSRLKDVPSGEFMDISILGERACALRLDGTITCWGDFAGPGLPNPPSGAHQSIAVASNYACALREDRTIACWGMGKDWERADASGVLDTPAGTYAAVSPGNRHACALRTDGAIRCWGDERSGLTDSPSGTFTALAADGGACAVRADGTAHCWDSTFSGQQQFDFGGNGSQPIASIAGGNSTVCALDTNSHLACKHAQLATVVGNEIIVADGSSFDVSVPNGPFSSISVGSRSGCGLRPDGAIACWGRGHDNLHVPPGNYQSLSNSCGLRIDGTMVCWKGLRAPDLPLSFWGRGVRSGVAVFPGEYVAMSSGPPPGSFNGHFAVCGVTTDAALNCFGADLVTGWVSRQPQRIEGSYESVVVGHGAACALRTDSTISCWGEESARQFGMLDAPSGTFTQISAGFLHFCAIRSNQSVTCWGHNGADQLDAPGGRFTSISSGGDLTFGVRPDGSAVSWGDHNWGGGWTNWTGFSPEQRFALISLGPQGGCYVGPAGSTGCFGPAGSGMRPPHLSQLGLDESGKFLEWTSIDFNSRCGIRSDDGVTCWPELPDGVTWHTAETMIWTYGDDLPGPHQWAW